MCRCDLLEILLRIFILSFFVFSVKSGIHHDMSFDDINQFFGRSDGLVPKYESVKFRLSKIRRRRSDDGPPILKPKEAFHLETRVFGKDIDVWLHPSDGILVDDEIPVYYGSYSETEVKKVKYTRVYNLMDKVGKLYVDTKTSTSLVIGNNDYNKYNINGIIGSDNIVLKTLPSEMVDNVTRRRRNIDKSYDPSNLLYLIAFKSDEMAVKANETLKAAKLARLRKSFTSERPDIFYPEILVIVDFSAYEYCGNENDVINYLTYLLAFWNGVDLKFRSLINPGIRLHLSAIIFSDSPRATPYIYKNMKSMTEFNSTEALKKSWLYFYSVKDIFPITSYDIIASMTKLRLISDDKLPVPDEGISLLRSVCRASYNDKEVYGIIIFYDNGVFKGIQNAAHEIGHTLGSLDEIEIRNCHNSDGYVMASPSVFTKNSSDFSLCSRIMFQRYFTHGGQNLWCLHNEPHGRPLPRFLPGKIKDLTTQCNAIGYEDSCRGESNVCVTLHCLDNERRCIKTKMAVLDGTKCDDGRGKSCLKTECVEL